MFGCWHLREGERADFYVIGTASACGNHALQTWETRQNVETNATNSSCALPSQDLDFLSKAADQRIGRPTPLVHIHDQLHRHALSAVQTLNHAAVASLHTACTADTSMYRSQVMA